MRNYWLRIGVGALAVFTVGMIIVTVVRNGMNHVSSVANSTEPISIPLAFIPFNVGGRRLGTLEHLELVRDSPRRVSRVNLTVNLADSAALAGLERCRVVADFDWDRGPGGVAVTASRDRYERGTFRCATRDSTPAGTEEYGSVTFRPSGHMVPLLLPNTLVADLRRGDFNDQASDSAADIAERRADSLSDAADHVADSLEAVGDSLASRFEEMSQRTADSIRAAVERKVDSIRARR